jgi:hypothetical protein
MGSLVFICPATGREVSTGIEIDSGSFGSLANGFTELSCPHCCGLHQLLTTQTWISAEAWPDDRPPREALTSDSSESPAPSAEA